MANLIDDFLNALASEMPRCDAERLGAERYGSPRLSAFELLGTKETTLSYVISDLLDPRGTHGQGTLFLNAMLRAIKQPEVHVRDAIRVQREFLTKHKRRIDILIETPNSLIGIENKPFAGQGESQLIDYHTDLVERAGDRRTPCLVFLSDSDPETAKNHTNILRFYDWGEDLPSLSGMLREVDGEIRSTRSRAFVKDFHDWIARHLGGEEMTDELEPYAEEVLARLKRRRDRKAIGAVMLASDSIRCEVIDEIGQHFWTILRKTYPDLEREEGELSVSIDVDKDSWAMRDPSWPKNCVLAIEAQKKGACDVIYGIQALKPGTPEAEREPNYVCHDREGFEEGLQDLANGSSSNWWPWYQSAPTSAWSQEFIARLLIETNGEIVEHDDVKKMTADMIRLAEIIHTSDC
ncbi:MULTISPECIES: PD-(D/E)XK nuclease family protein [unclassified Roseovarius]|uniref:PDDEXK-like family protein n=1 Tax=unclassified Roseovarius TaxID=2614913 RepID=UPI00273FA1F7|nr:PD-(D/E)XK nuclease family protein [Roseovarius sp. MMSF_3350]